MSTLNCPQCGQLDKVQKVSALFTQGTSHTSYETPSAAVQIKDTIFYGTQERTATSRTALSERLAPPTRPNIMKPVELTYKLGPGVIVNGVIVGIIILIGFVMFAVNGQNNDGLGMCFGGALMIVPAFFYFRDISRIQSGKARQKFEAEMDTYNRTVSEYKSAQNRWDSAYYCGRCDGVFTPGLSKFTPINQFYKFLEG